MQGLESVTARNVTLDSGKDERSTGGVTGTWLEIWKRNGTT